MDFGFAGKAADNTTNSDVAKTNTTDSTITDLGDGTTVTQVGAEIVTDLNEDGTPKDKSKVDPKIVDKSGTTTDTNTDGNKNVDKSTTTTNDDLVTGSIIELGDDKYTVDATGNLVDKTGTVFKEAKDVKDWLATFDKIDDGSKDELSISTIQEVIGVDIVGEDDKPIEFENTPAGVKAYIDAVTEANRDEHYEQAINTLYQKYPVLPDVLNYYIANGNSLEGFGEVHDRSGITIDDTNEAQQENVIRTAWIEQNRKGDVESYIAYLKSSGTLLPTSKEELKGLQELDAQTKQELEAEAAEVEKTRIEKLQTYWGGIKEIIDKKSISGYQIPDTIIINKDGKKTAATPNDFYNYLYQVDANGKSAYERELAKENPINRREDEILRAYLKYVGGNYSNLVGMAVNNDKIKTLKLQSANRTANSIKVTKPKTNNTQGKNIDLGFN